MGNANIQARLFETKFEINNKHKYCDFEIKSEKLKYKIFFV